MPSGSTSQSPEEASLPVAAVSASTIDLPTSAAAIQHAAANQSALHYLHTPQHHAAIVDSAANPSVQPIAAAPVFAANPPPTRHAVHAANPSQLRHSEPDSVTPMLAGAAAGGQSGHAFSQATEAQSASMLHVPTPHAGNANGGQSSNRAGAAGADSTGPMISVSMHELSALIAQHVHDAVKAVQPNDRRRDDSDDDLYAADNSRASRRNGGDQERKPLPRLGKLNNWNSSIDTWVTWIADARVACQNARVPADEEYRAVANYIEGRAKEMLSELPSYRLPRTLVELEEWVMREVCTPSDRQRAWTDLKTIAWQKSVEATARVFRKSLRLLPEEDRRCREVMDCFRNAVPERIALRLSELDVREFEEAVRVATHKEGELIRTYQGTQSWSTEFGHVKSSSKSIRPVALNAMPASYAHDDEFASARFVPFELTDSDVDLEFNAMPGPSASEAQPSRGQQGHGGRSGRDSGGRGRSGVSSALAGGNCCICKKPGHGYKDCEVGKRPENHDMVRQLDSLFARYREIRRELVNFTARQ